MRLIKENRLETITILLDTTSNNQNIWKDIKISAYLFILAMPEMLLKPYSQFWVSIIYNKANWFCQQLTYIAVNKVYLIWSWREFCFQYNNVKILHIVFLRVVILTIFIFNILKYRRTILKIRTPVQSYYQLLDRFNIIYTIAPTHIIKVDI